MFKNINLIIITFFILHCKICPAMPVKTINKSEESLLNKEIFMNSSEDTHEVFIIHLLENILDKRTALLPNSHWLGWKILFIALVPLSVGLNNLVLAVNSNITPELILVTQFTVPFNIYNNFNILDKTRVIYKKGFKQNFLRYKKNIINSCCLLLAISASIYLSYLSALIDSETSADAYHWIFSNFTNSQKVLTGAHYTGYILKLIFTMLLNSVFFFNFINEVKDNIGINWCLGVSKEFASDKQQAIYYGHVNNLKTIIYENFSGDYTEEIEDYLVDHKLNNVLDIANLRFYSANYSSYYSVNQNYTTNKCFDVFVNITKLCFISTMAVFCSEAFKKIFASKLLIKNFIEDFANKTANGSYELPLKNHKMFVCDSINDCIVNLDFNQVEATTNQIDYLLSADKTAIIANILKGIAVSTNTAIMLIILSRYSYKIIKNKWFRQMVVKGYTQKDNIIPVLVSTTLFISGYYYLQNIYNTMLVAKKADDLLNNAGKKSFIGARASVILVMSAMGLTCSKGVMFLIDLTRCCLNNIKKCCD